MAARPAKRASFFDLRLRRLRDHVWIVALLLVGTVGAAYFVARGPDTVAIPAIGGPFRLASSKGGTFGSDDLKGKPYLIFFGFTHCPDICPTTLAEVSGLTAALHEQKRSIPVLFVSIDPERDTPEKLRDYLSSFGDDVIGLSGTEAQTEAVGKAFRVYYRRVPLKDDDYTMDHSAVTYVMDGKNRFVATLPSNREAALKLLERVLDRPDGA